MPDVTNDAVKLIPDDHTFLDLDTYVTVKAKDKIMELMEQAQNRCPDDFEMYIYNDFWAYGVFDLVDQTMTSLNTKIKKKDWKEAIDVLQALFIFSDSEAIWTQCDDGGRVRVTKKAIGAAALAVFQGLEKSEGFSTASYPNLEKLLQTCCRISKEGQVCSTRYEPVLKGIARRLFVGKTEADFIREREMAEEWVRGLRDNSDDDDEDEDEDDEDEGEPRGKKGMEKALKKIADKHAAAKAAGMPFRPWFVEGEIIANVPNDIKFARAWKEYKDYLAGCPRVPMRGPPKWDLTTWTATEKEPFQF